MMTQLIRLNMKLTLAVHMYTQKNILLLRKVTQFTFFLSNNDYFNKEYFFENNFKIYLLQILEKLIVLYLKEEFIF